jgi:hypothetical protein
MDRKCPQVATGILHEHHLSSIGPLGAARNAILAGSLTTENGRFARRNSPISPMVFSFPKNETDMWFVT